MKKIISLVLILATVLGTLSFAGCRDGDLPTEGEEELFSGETDFDVIPVLPQGAIPETPDYINAVYTNQGVIYGDYHIYWDTTLQRYSFQLLSSPMPKGAPIYFDALSPKENPLYDVKGIFLVDPVASAQNNGVPVILIVNEISTRLGIGSSISHWQVLSFNMKTQKVKVIIDNIPDKVNSMMMYRDRLYLTADSGDRGSTIYSLNTDGTDVQTMENPEKEKRWIVYAAGGRLYYLVGSTFLFSCNADFSDVQFHQQINQNVRLMVHDGYLYFPEKQEAQTYGEIRHISYHYYRAPFSDLTKKELVLENIYGAGAPQGTVLPFRKVEDIGKNEKGRVCFRGLYLFDVKTGEVKTVFQSEEAFQSNAMAFDSCVVIGIT